MLRQRRAAGAIIFAVVISQFGCATAPSNRAAQFLPYPPEHLRSEFGTVGVAPGYASLQFDITGLARSRGQGALRGAGAGAALVGVGACSVVVWAPFIGWVLCPVAAAGGAVVGAVVGAPVGAVLAEPAGKVEEKEAAIRQVAAALSLHEALRDRVITAGRNQTAHAFRAISGERPDGAVQPIDYSALVREGLDTIIEVTVERISLDAPWGVSLPLSLVMTVRTRLLRPAEATRLYEHSLSYHSPARPLNDWVADDSLRLRQELERAYTALAEKIIDEIFLVTR